MLFEVDELGTDPSVADRGAMLPLAKLAASTLAGMGREAASAIPALERATSSPDRDVARAAESALLSIRRRL